MKKLITAVTTLFALPVAIVSAQANLDYFADFSNDLMGIISGILIPLMISIAVLLFLWGLFMAFIWGGDDAEKRTEGKKYMGWALIAFVVMVSLWGIVELLQMIFGVDGGVVQVPSAPVPRATP